MELEFYGWLLDNFLTGKETKDERDLDFFHSLFAWKSFGLEVENRQGCGERPLE